MNENLLKSVVGIFIVLSHFGLLFLVVALTISGKFTKPEMYTSIGLMLPLFAAYTTAIVKSFLASTPNSADLSRVAFQRLFVSLLIPALLAIFILTAIAWKALGSLDFDNFSGMLGLAETAFGVYIGSIVKSLFDRGASPVVDSGPTENGA